MANKKGPRTPASASDKAAKEAARVAKFKTVAKKRVPKALKAISLIGNLSSRAGYSYTPEQVEKIQGDLIAAVKNTMARFSVTASGSATVADYDI